eukprot:2591475-Pleurochrysis_carterae.AAC.1
MHRRKAIRPLKILWIRTRAPGWPKKAVRQQAAAEVLKDAVEEMQRQVDLTMFYKSGAVSMYRRRKRTRDFPTQPSGNA